MGWATVTQVKDRKLLIRGHRCIYKYNQTKLLGGLTRTTVGICLVYYFVVWDFLMCSSLSNYMPVVQRSNNATKHLQTRPQWQGWGLVRTATWGKVSCFTLP